MDSREEIIVETLRDLAVPALVGSGGLLAGLRAWWRRRKIRRRIEKAEAEALTELLDAVRYLYHFLAQEGDLIEASRHREAITRHHFEIDEVRERLWVARGNRSKRIGADV